TVEVMVINRMAWVSSSTALIVALVATSFWYSEHRELHASRVQFRIAELQPIAMLLKENMDLMRELKSEPFRENDSGILESYLVKIRRDGVSKHADMKQRLDVLAENNTAIITLIKAYVA